MRRMHSWMITLMVTGLSQSLVWAGPSKTPPTATDRVDKLMTRHNLHPAFEKLGRGMGNVLFGWAEIPLGIHRRYTTSDVGTSFFTGAIHGTFKGIVRTGVGAYEIVTFFLPYPDEFAPILPTLGYFQKSPKRDRLPLE